MDSLYRVSSNIPYCEFSPQHGNVIWQVVTRNCWDEDGMVDGIRRWERYVTFQKVDIARGKQY